MTEERAYADSGRQSVGGLTIRSTAIALILGAVAGAAVGAAVGVSRPVVHHATTVASILPDNAVINTQLPGTSNTQDATDFIQSELVVLNGQELLSRVQQQLRLASLPSVSSSQVGATYVVNIVASDRNAARAVAAADATRTLYAQQRQAELTGDINTAFKTVRKQISAVRTAIDAEPAKKAAGGGTDALQQNYSQLLSSSNALQLDAGQVGRAVTTIQPATITDSGASTSTKYVLAGLVVGALLMAALLVAFRRLVPRVRSNADLAALGIPVAEPALPWVSGRRPNEARGAARLLAIRLTGAVTDSSGQSRTPALVLLGLDRGVGTTFRAAELAAALGTSQPVVYLEASENIAEPSVHRGPGTPPMGLPATESGAQAQLLDAVVNHIGPGVLGMHLSPRQVTQGFISDLEAAAASNRAVVIIDAPPLQDDDLGARFARGGARVVLVVARGRSEPARVMSTVEALDAAGARTVEVLFTRLRRRAGTPTRNKAAVANRPSPSQLPEGDPGVVMSNNVITQSPSEPALSNPVETETLTPGSDGADTGNESSRSQLGRLEALRESVRSQGA